MEMHELEQAWRGVETRLQQQTQVFDQWRRRQGTELARARLRLVTAGQWLQLAVGVLVMLWAGGYWTAHLAQPALLASGVAVHLHGLGLVVVSALQLVQLARIDYDAPVLALQQRLVALRRVRFAGERVLLAFGLALWLPIGLIVLHRFGIDAWSTSPSIVLGNLAVALALSALVAGLMHRYRDAFERDAAGQRLREVEAELSALVSE